MPFWEERQTQRRECHVKTQRHKRKTAMWQWEETLELCCSKPRNAKDLQQTPEAQRERHGMQPPSEPPERANLANTLNLNCEKISFCCFKPKEKSQQPVQGSFVPSFPQLHVSRSRRLLFRDWHIYASISPVFVSKFPSIQVLGATLP